MDRKKEIILNVPYAEKEKVKALGAKWNPDIKRWYVPVGVDSTPFAHWMTQRSDDDASYLPIR